MSVETETDRANFLADFGESVTVSGNAITAMMDNEWLSEAVGGLEIDSLEPALLCRATDVSSSVNGDAVTARGTAYTIKDTQPAGDGWTLILLER